MQNLFEPNQCLNCGMPVYGLSLLCQACDEEERRKEEYVDESDKDYV